MLPPGHRRRSCFTRSRPNCCSAGRVPTGRRDASICCRTFARDRKSVVSPDAAIPPISRASLRSSPTLFSDVGSTSATFVSLAERVQQQTGIPYALLDGRFEAIAPTYRKLGELINRQGDGGKLPGVAAQARHAARYADDTVKTITGRIATIAPGGRVSLKRARTARAGDPARRLDQCGNDRNAGPERCRWATTAGSANASIEQVLLWNPDVIITIDQDFAARAHRSRMSTSVKAVRDGRVHLFHRKCRSAGSISRLQ